MELGRAGFSHGAIAALFATTTTVVKQVVLGQANLPGTEVPPEVPGDPGPGPFVDEQLSGALRAGSQWSILAQGNLGAGGSSDALFTLKEMWEDPILEGDVVDSANRVVVSNPPNNLAVTPQGVGPNGTFLTLVFDISLPDFGDNVTISLSDVDGTPGQPPVITGGEWVRPTPPPATGGGGAVVQNLEAATFTDFEGLDGAKMFEISIEGVLTPPDGSRDRFVYVRPNAVDAGPFRTVSNACFIDADGSMADVTQDRGPGGGFVVGATGWALECALSGRATIQARLSSIGRRVSRGSYAAAPDVGDNRVMAVDVGSWWGDGTTDVTSLHFDFDGAEFTGTIAVTAIQ